MARAVELVDSVVKTLAEHQKEKYFLNKIWPTANKLAEKNGIDIDRFANHRQSCGAPSCLADSVIVAPIGRRSCTVTSYENSHVLYFLILKKVISEIHFFYESRTAILVVAACDPNSMQFLDADTLKPLTNEYNIDLSILELQLSVAKSMLFRNVDVKTLEDVYHSIASMSTAFPHLCTFLRAALTIPVSSASAE